MTKNYGHEQSSGREVSKSSYISVKKSDLFSISKHCSS